MLSVQVAWEMLILLQFLALLQTSQLTLPKILICLFSQQGQCCSAVRTGQFIFLLEQTLSLAMCKAWSDLDWEA